MPKEASAEANVRNIRSNSRRKFTAEEKILIVLEGLRGETTIAALCRHGGIHNNLYYRCGCCWGGPGAERRLPRNCI